MDGWWDKDGIFRCGGSYEDPDHIVVIVGYNDSIPGYWIAKNSWGEDWGLDGGYFKLGYYECGPKFPYTKGVTMGLQWPPLKTNNRTGNITNLTYSGGGNNIGDKIKRGFGGKIECLNTSVNASTGSGSVECDDREDCSLGPCVEKSGNPEICTCCTNEVLEEEPEGEKCDPPGGDPGVGSLQCKITMEQQNKDWKCNTKDCTCVLKVNITEPPPR